MRISMIGAGYVGLVTGLCLAEKGHHVVCVEADPNKVATLRSGQAPIHEPGLDELLRRHLGNRFEVTSDLTDAVGRTDLTMIAVGTPFAGSRIDLTFVRQAAREVGAAIGRKDGYHVVVVKSTVVPGTTDDVVTPILEEHSGRRAGAELGVGTNPEFLSEGTAIADFLEPDRIVIGGNDQRCRDQIAGLYEQFPGVPQLQVANKVAEMIKYASNSLLATLISFSNEIGNLCTAIGGIDTRDVFRGVHLSQYLTPRTADGKRQTAPIAAFLSAGCGFGGSCLPKDVQALIGHGRDHNQSMPLLSAVMEVNHGQPGRMIGLLKKRFPDLAGLKTTVLGLAFKPDTDDIRESPAIPIVRQLIAEGAQVRAYDPAANDNARRILGDVPVEFCCELEAAVADADAALLVTRWDEFSRIPELFRTRSPQPLLVDGRRMIDPASIDNYEGIGV